MDGIYIFDCSTIIKCNRARTSFPYCIGLYFIIQYLQVSVVSGMVATFSFIFVHITIHEWPFYCFGSTSFQIFYVNVIPYNSEVRWNNASMRNLMMMMIQGSWYPLSSSPSAQSTNVRFLMDSFVLRNVLCLKSAVVDQGRQHVSKDAIVLCKPGTR